MKKLLLLGVILITSNIQAQTILNGSFETTTAPASCSYNISNASYNSLMSNSNAFGLYEAMDIVVSGCYIPSVPNGTYSISLANNPSNNIEGEAVSLELSSPLAIGNNYEVSFQAFANTDFGPQGDLLIGYSTANNSFGNLVDTVNTIVGTWTSFTLNFTATTNATHISVMPVSGVSSWNFIDDFSIIETCSSTTGIDPVTACNSHTWIDGNTYTASNNTATWLETNAAGCDSIVTLDLTINPLPDTSVTYNGNSITATGQNGNIHVLLDCDNNFALLDTTIGWWNLLPTQYANSVGNYALEITTLDGCIDTSSCYYLDVAGIEEITSENKELVKVVDLMGRETTPQKNMVLIYVYSDGTMERIFEFE